MEPRKTVSTLNYATTAIVAASAGMVLARPESPLIRRNNDYGSPSPPLNSRNSISPISSRDNSPFPGTRAYVTTPNGDSPSSQTTGWVNNSPQKNSSPHFEREDTPLSMDSITSPVSSAGRKPQKLKRRRSSKPTPPFFGWRSKSKSPPVEEVAPTPSPPVMLNHEEHYHLYDIGTRTSTRPTPTNPRHSIASIHSVSGGNPRTPLKRIYPPPQKKDSPRLISPSSLCQVHACNGSPAREEQLLIKALRRTSDGNISPSRMNGHKRNQSVPSFDNELPATPTPDRQTNGFAYKTPSRSGEPTVWLVSERNTPQQETFASQARRRLEFGSQHARKSSGGSSYARRIASSSPPPETIPERCDSLNWDSEESDPTYESMKMDQDSGRRKSRLSSIFDDADYEKAIIPDDKSPRTIVHVISDKTEDDDLDWDDSFPVSKGHANIKRRLPSSKEMAELHIPARTTSLSRSKSVPPTRPDPSPERPKRLSAPKECWDNDFEDEGSDMWMIPENITEAQDKLKGYLSNIKTFSTLIEDLKQFRQLHSRSHPRPVPQEQLLDEIDAMIEISTLDGFSPPPFQGPPPSPKKSNASLASSQWSFEDKFASISIEDENRSIPTPPPAADPDAERRDLQARRLLEKILGECDDARIEVKPEQLTKMISYVNALRSRCEEFDSVDEIKSESWNIEMGVYG